MVTWNFITVIAQRWCIKTQALVTRTIYTSFVRQSVNGICHMLFIVFVIDSDLFRSAFLQICFHLSWRCSPATVLFVSNQRQSEHSIANRTKTLLDHCPLKWMRRRESFPLPKLGVLVVLTDGELGTPLLRRWTKIKIIACCLGRESRTKEK